MGILRVACVQMCSGVDPDANIKQLDALVRAAAEQGAFYIQTPEMSGILQKDRKALLHSIAKRKDCTILNHCRTLSKELGIWLHLGSTAISVENDKAANRSVLFSPKGEELAIYDKIHMFDVDVDENNRWKESSRYQAGSEAKLVDIEGVKFGLAICYDIRFPQLFRHYAKQGASILTCPSAFTKPTGEAHWEILLRARAIENGAFMIAAAQSGLHEDGRETYGHSMIVDPWGEVVGELKDEGPNILVKDIDLGAVKKARQKIPNIVNEKKFSISSVKYS